MSKTRINWLDIAKGISIISVIIGHTLTNDNIYSLIYSFHMPIFFILTGYTLKNITKEKLKEETKKDFKKLIIPSLIIILITTIITSIKKNLTIGEIILSLINKIIWGNGSAEQFGNIKLLGIGFVWFLLVLFYSKFIYRLMLVYNVKKRLLITYILSFISIIIGTKIHFIHSIDLIFLVIFYLEIGNLYKKEENNKYFNKRWITIIIAIIWLYLSVYKRIAINIAGRVYPYGIICILVSLSGSFSIIKLSKMLSKIEISKPLIFIGKNSLQLLIIHCIENSIFTWGEKGTKIIIIRLLLNLTILFIYNFIKNLKINLNYRKT